MKSNLDQCILYIFSSDIVYFMSSSSSSFLSNVSGMNPFSSVGSSSRAPTFGSVSSGSSGFSGPGSFLRSSPFSQFSSNKYVSGTREFLESNSIVAKFAFLILVLIAFVVLLRLGTWIIPRAENRFVIRRECILFFRVGPGINS